MAFSALSVVIAWIVGGQKAAAGMALGLFSVSLNIVVLAKIVSHLASTGQSERPIGKTAFLVGALFVKLPLFVFFVFLVYKMGGNALSGFALGILLVYCGLVGWSLAQGAR